MGSYLLQRLAGVLAVIVGLVLFTFFVTELIGDPVSLMVDPELATEADLDAIREAIREANGLNDPLAVRFGRYLSEVARGDFGTSL